jgi:hypothetical protein
MLNHKSQIQAWLEELEQLTRTMDVPVYRRNNVAWLNKSLAVKNKSHANFEKAMGLIKELLSHGVCHG